MFHAYGDGYKAKASASRELTIDFDLGSGQLVFPLIRVADFDGDGLSDLLMGHGNSRINLYAGVNNGKLFARNKQKFATALPKNGQMVVTNDLNRDGKMDLVIRYDKLDGAALAGQLQILLAR